MTIRVTNANVYEGALVMVDDGFTCIAPWTITRLLKDADGYYFECSQGRHYLDGQYDDDKGYYIGLIMWGNPWPIQNN